jgi:hypothetical protein
MVISPNAFGSSIWMKPYFLKNRILDTFLLKILATIRSNLEVFFRTKHTKKQIK